MNKCSQQLLHFSWTISLFSIRPDATSHGTYLKRKSIRLLESPIKCRISYRIRSRRQLLLSTLGLRYGRYNGRRGPGQQHLWHDLFLFSLQVFGILHHIDIIEWTTNMVGNTYSRLKRDATRNGMMINADECRYWIK